MSRKKTVFMALLVNIKFESFNEGDAGEAEANPTLLLEDRDDAFLKHSANLPVSAYKKIDIFFKIICSMLRFACDLILYNTFELISSRHSEALKLSSGIVQPIIYFQIKQSDGSNARLA